jgi:putative Holliday junction resolvase
MRVLGVDAGRRRIGLAVSDRSGTLATPLGTLAVARGSGVDLVDAEIRRLQAEEDGLSIVVVGLPRHLDGSESEETIRVGAFIAELSARTAVPVVAQDERLSSREAESRLARREKDWRRRKTRLDAAAAAVILQDYLDGERRMG